MSFNVLYGGAGKKLFQVTCENVTGDPVKKLNTLLRSFKDIEILTIIACGTQQIKFVLVCEQWKVAMWILEGNERIQETTN